jgi:hypothetical protein
MMDRHTRQAFAHDLDRNRALEDELIHALPEGLRSKVAWAYKRAYWKDIEVAFITNDRGSPKRVRVPEEWWLTEHAIAWLCLQAP